MGQRDPPWETFDEVVSLYRGGRTPIRSLVADINRWLRRNGSDEVVIIVRKGAKK